MLAKSVFRAPVGVMLATGTLLAAALPMTAQATAVTFNWVPTTENPASGPSTAHGSITLDISPWANTTISGNGLGPNYWTSSASVAATITALSYTFGNGVTVGLSNLSSTSISRLWQTSATDTPATGAQAPSSPVAGYYLVTQFSVSGTVAGTPFMLANAAGFAGTNLPTGLGNGGNTIQPPTSIADGGYWMLAPAAPVPLPATLPLVLSGLAALGGAARRRRAQGA